MVAAFSPATESPDCDIINQLSGKPHSCCNTTRRHGIVKQVGVGICEFKRNTA